MVKLSLAVSALWICSCSKQSCFGAAFEAAHAHAELACPEGSWEDCPDRELVELELDAALRGCQEISK